MLQTRQAVTQMRCRVAAMRRDVDQARGFTIVEVLVSSLIASVIAGGTMMAYVTAARISREQNSPQSAEAELYAQQTIEGFRNRIAERPTAEMPWPEIAPNLNKWQADDLPWANGVNLPNNAETGSILQPPGASRVYCVFPIDSNGDGVIDDRDSYGIQVKVCWLGTACPVVGTPCP